MQAAVAKPKAEQRKAPSVPERKGLGSVGAELDTGAPAGMPAFLQRKCAACEEEEITTNLARTETRGSDAQPNASVVRRAISDQGAGHSLPEPTRIKMERSFGVDLGGVRIHTGSTANAASRNVNAEAFTHGQSIYFAQGRYQPESPAGSELLAHELTHAVQNRYAADVPATAGISPRGFSLSRSGDPAEQEADSAAQAVSTGQPANVQGAPTASIQREEKGAFDKALDWTAARADDAGSAISSGVKAVGEFASDQLMSLLRTVAPQLADIIDEGPINFAKRKINEALDAHMPQALGGFSLSELVEGVSGWLGEAATFAKALVKGDQKACDAFAGMMEKLSQFVTALIDNPVINAFTSALTKVSDFIGKVVKLVAEPLFDNMVKQVSGAWTVLKKISSTVSGWINKAKKAVGSLWDELSKALGFDGTNEEGVWSYLKGIGKDIWEGIKATLAPVVEPIKKAGIAVALLTPMGQVHAIVKYGPKLVKVVTWIWDNGLNPDKIKDAPEEIQGMLTSLISGVDGFKGLVQSGLDWLSAKLSAMADTVLEVVGAITGLPLIGFAQSLFEDAQSTLKTLVTDIKKGAKDALVAIEAVATKISDFIAPYKEVISSFILAIVSPPMIPLIFAGWGWRKLPSCIKIPILNFILDIAIAAIGAIPAVATFGSLWPLLKPAVMTFLGTLRAADDKVKEKISNKIAKVISGASPEFLIGFVKGFAVGVWEGITDPLKAIWMVLEGLDTATQYMASLAGFGDKEETKKPPEAAAPSMSAPSASGSSAVSSISASPSKLTSTINSTPSAPQAPAVKPEEDEPYVPVDPKAALNKADAKMPESTRKLLEKLAADKAAREAAHPAGPAQSAEPEPAPESAGSTAMPPADMAAVKVQASAAYSQIAPDVQTVKGGFWDAVQEYFNGKGMSFDDMVSKLSEAWESAKSKISEGASWFANQLMGFFHGNQAEAELGDKIGWLTGTIVFQVVLDAITAGTWIAAGPVLKGIAKFINWPMEFLGEAFKLLKKLGKYLIDGLKSLGSVIKDAAAGAFKTVSKALGNIGERLLVLGEEILGKFGGKAAKAESKAVGVLGKEGTKLAEQKGAKVLTEAEEKAAQKLEQQTAKVEPHPTAGPEPKPHAATEPKAEPHPGTESKAPGETVEVDKVHPESAAKREASVAESGHVESDKLTPQQTRNETDQFRSRPESLEGTPPHRKSKMGEHEWREEQLPNGDCTFCRHSATKICVATPELRAKELEKTEKHVLGLEEQADVQAKAAAEAREKAMAHQPLSPEDEKYLNKDLQEAKDRADAAKKRLRTERGNATKNANTGKAEEAAAAQKKVESLEAELKRAEEDARTAQQMLDEQAHALKRAEDSEALATAAKKEAETAAKTVEDMKALEKELAKTEADLAALNKKRPWMKDEPTHRKMQELETKIADQKKQLAAQIEASKGLTPEARETLRKGTPFKGPGGAKRESTFLENLPPEAKGPNSTYVDYVTGETLPLAELHIDHVVPVEQIFGMEGFGRLSRADQQAILDLPQNLRFLEESRNTSKGAKGLADWLGGKTAKAPKLPAAEREALAKLEADARKKIEDEIAKRLKKMGTP